MKTENTIEQVRIAYSDAGEQRDSDEYEHSERCLSFAPSEMMSADEAKTAVRAIRSYNHFDGENIAAAIDRIESTAENPLFLVCRESSPALYVECEPENSVTVREILETVGPNELSTGDRAAATWQRDRSPEEVHSVCRHEEPVTTTDEWPDIPSHRVAVRAWWD